MDEILGWKDQIGQEIGMLTEAQVQISESISVYLTDLKYEPLLASIREITVKLDTLHCTYGKRFVHLAHFYDKATKISTLVNENYEKLEECVEVTRTELKELIKKLCSFSTLEMDYYDKLLNIRRDSGSTFQQDYEQYRMRLDQIHRYDQVQLFGNTVSSMIYTVIHILTKLISILDNSENMNEIEQLWSKPRQDFRY